jgi:hypothetical protein
MQKLKINILKLYYLLKRKPINVETRETFFWLSLLKETGYLKSEKADPVLSKCDEVIRILCAILKTTNQNT